jgi:hypothetical protein
MNSNNVLNNTNNKKEENQVILSNVLTETEKTDEVIDFSEKKPFCILGYIIYFIILFFIFLILATIFDIVRYFF